MHVNKILNDITILFTGHNIKPFAVLAIESFLLHNPNMRKNIIFYDDESTDGTKEELESRGIRVITWLPQIKEKFLEYEKFAMSNFHVISCLPQRVAYINYCAAMQVKTTYLYLSDGDMIYFDNFFLHCVQEFAKSNCLVAGSRDYIQIDAGQDTTLMEYMELLKGQNDLIETKTENGLNYKRVRIYPNQMLINLKALKNKGIVFDNLNLHPYDDTGQDFYRQLMRNNIPLAEVVPYDDIQGQNRWFTHLNWLSSLRRIVLQHTICDYEKMVIERLKGKFVDARVSEVCAKLGLDAVKIIDEFIKNLGA